MEVKKETYSKYREKLGDPVRENCAGGNGMGGRGEKEEEKVRGRGEEEEAERAHYPRGSLHLSAGFATLRLSVLPASLGLYSFAEAGYPLDFAWSSYLHCHGEVIHLQASLGSP